MKESIIFYYPEKKNAPAHVARSLFEELTKTGIPFQISPYLQKKELVPELSNCIKASGIASLKEVLSGTQKRIVHFTLNPTVFPNKKFMLLLACLLKGHSMIINYHGDPREEFLIQLKSFNRACILYVPEYIFLPFVMKRACYIVVNSFLMKDLFETKYGLNNVVVIPNGINQCWLSETDTKDGTMKPMLKDEADADDAQCSGAFEIVYHGRLAPEKGVDLLLKGFKKFLQIQDSDPQSSLSHLTIIGSGPLQSKLENLSSELGISENISFPGRVSDPQLAHHLRKATVAIYPSIYEPFSLAILEAFTTVKGPVIYTKNIGINDFVEKEGYRFLTFEPTAEDICNKLLMVSKQRYPGSLPAQQREFAAKYSWEIIARQYVQLYSNLI
jgi:glycosyltransferase involved in cell wall biosynthesis